MSSLLLKYAPLIIPNFPKNSGLRAGGPRMDPMPPLPNPAQVRASELRPWKHSLENSSHHQSAIKRLGIISRVLDTRAVADTRNLLRLVPCWLAHQDPHREF